MVIKIPLDGGLVTQVDPDDIGASACTQLTNAEFDKAGVLYKRNGLDAGVNIHPDTLNAINYFTNNEVYLRSIKRFYNPNLDSKYVWVATYVKGYTSTSEYIALYYSTDG